MLVFFWHKRCQDQEVPSDFVTSRTIFASAHRSLRLPSPYRPLPTTGNSQNEPFTVIRWTPVVETGQIERRTHNYLRVVCVRRNRMNSDLFLFILLQNTKEIFCGLMKPDQFSRKTWKRRKTVFLYIHRTVSSQILKPLLSTAMRSTALKEKWTKEVEER
jgi:hypothetical protein